MTKHANRGVVGLISDTHGLLRPSVHTTLAGVDMILHAGDVGGEEILTELRIIAPVYAVYGNTDDIHDPSLSQEVVLDIAGMSVHVSHGHEVGGPKPEKLAERYSQDIVVYGHTHRQLVSRLGRQLIINPGAAGQQRFKLLPTVARLTIEDGKADVEIMALE